MSDRKCRECGVTLVVEDDRWVDAQSGDEGGTYDYCREAYDGAHHPGVKA